MVCRKVCYCAALSSSQSPAVLFIAVRYLEFETFTLKKLECSKQATHARIHEHGIME